MQTEIVYFKNSLFWKCDVTQLTGKSEQKSCVSVLCTGYNLNASEWRLKVVAVWQGGLFTSSHNVKNKYICMMLQL